MMVEDDKNNAEDDLSHIFGDADTDGDGQMSRSEVDAINVGSVNPRRIEMNTTASFLVRKSWIFLWKNMFNYRGRADYASFRLAVNWFVFRAIPFVGVGLIVIFRNTDNWRSWGTILIMVGVFGVYFAALAALFVRRLHDVGADGGMVWWLLVPVYGWRKVWPLLKRESDAGANRFGEPYSFWVEADKHEKALYKVYDSSVYPIREVKKGLLVPVVVLTFFAPIIAAILWFFLYADYRKPNVIPRWKWVMWACLVILPLSIMWQVLFIEAIIVGMMDVFLGYGAFLTPMFYQFS